MSNLYDIIKSFNDKNIGELPSVAAIKKHDITRRLGKYLKGGLSKLKKDDIEKLVEKLGKYEKDKFFVNDNELIPNDEQCEIISADINHHIRVIAGAGTGKTTTIMCRVKHLLDNYTTPDKILILTFNIDARKNLEKMLEKIIGFEINVEIRTIDSFCFKLISDFSNNQINKLSLAEYGRNGAKIMKQYAHTLKYSHVFFDEFQDVNEDQFLILKSFAKNKAFLTVIGDDSQNIYQFRGSDNYYIINFDKIFKNTKTYQITTNYRSTQSIIDLANESISNNDERIHKVMKTNTNLNGDITLDLYKKSKLYTSIIERIEYYINHDDPIIKCSYGDIAILARNTSHLRKIETQLEKSELPYISLITDKYGDKEKQIIENDKIAITTIHRSKGLEWKVVLMTGLTDIEFPSQMNNNFKNIEEERRLFYVGCTRAKLFLHFIESVDNVPISRFIEEIKDHVKFNIRLKKKDKIKEKMFSYYNINAENGNKKKHYDMPDLLLMMSGKKISHMKDSGLLPDIEAKEKYFHDQTLQQDDITLSKELIQNAFVSDFNIYCKTYFIRELLKKSDKELKYSFAENIINGIHLTEEENKLYNVFNLEYYLLNNMYSEDIPDKFQKYVNKLLLKFKSKVNNINVKEIHDSTDNLLTKQEGKTIVNRISDFHYPPAFMNNLRKSYNLFCNKDIDSGDILEGIYYVSLCKKFHNKRRRLVYRNIYHLFEPEFIKVKKTIDSFISNMDFKKKYLCNLNILKKFKMDNAEVKFITDINLIDVDKKTLYLAKITQNDYSIENTIEMISLFSLLKNNEKYQNTKIKYLTLINFLTGMKYTIKINKKYDYTKLIEYYHNIIEDNREGIRDTNNLDYEQLYDKDEDNIDNINLENTSTKDMISRIEDMQSLLFCSVSEINPNEPIKDQIEIIEFDKKFITRQQKRKNKLTKYMVIDVENNTLNGDIVQLAYAIYDMEHNLISEHNHYIKDRFIDWRAKTITNITNELLTKKGESYNKVMNKFLQTLIKCRFLVGHHVGTDISKIKSNNDVFNISLNYNIFNDLEIIDTATMYKKVHNKSGALNKIYHHLFDKHMTNAHNALVDVIHTQKIFSNMFDEYHEIIDKEKKDKEKKLNRKKKIKTVKKDSNQHIKKEPKYKEQNIETCSKKNNKKNKKKYDLSNIDFF
jgi:hypothetical protein